MKEIKSLAKIFGLLLLIISVAWRMYSQFMHNEPPILIAIGSLAATLIFCFVLLRSVWEEL